MFEGYWPAALDNPNLSEDEKAIARKLNEMGKIAFSKTLKPGKWKKTKVLADIVPQEVQKIKAQKGGDIVIYGSGSVIRRLTELGLIDEYVLAVVPTFLGRGKSMVEGLQSRLPLQLADHSAFPSGTAILRYSRREGVRSGQAGTTTAEFERHRECLGLWRESPSSPCDMGGDAAEHGVKRKRLPLATAGVEARRQHHHQQQGQRGEHS